MTITASPRALARALYGVYAWLIVLVLVLLAVVGLALAPRLRARRQVARWAARMIFLLMGSPVKLGGAHIATNQHCIVVANHGSYLDGIILTAVLPTHFTFLIKDEMSKFPVAGFILRRLGSEFVDRDKASHRQRIGRRLLDAANHGEALAVFPEGTFDEVAGLKRFQGGAFRAARRAGVRLYPTVILGARHKFPAGTALPRPGALAVHVCAPLDPAAFDSAEALLRATRAKMLALLEEPDLDSRELTSRRSSDRPLLPEAASECSEPGP